MPRRAGDGNTSTRSDGRSRHRCLDASRTVSGDSTSPWSARNARIVSGSVRAYWRSAQPIALRAKKSGSIGPRERVAQQPVDVGVGLVRELVQDRRAREPEFVALDPAVQRRHQLGVSPHERAHHARRERVDGVPPALGGHQCAHGVEQFRTGETNMTDQHVDGCVLHLAFVGEPGERSDLLEVRRRRRGQRGEHLLRDRPPLRCRYPEERELVTHVPPHRCGPLGVSGRSERGTHLADGDGRPALARSIAHDAPR